MAVDEPTKAKAPHLAGLKVAVLAGLSFGAGDEIRTRDIYLGKVVLYQLSYSRIRELPPL